MSSIFISYSHKDKDYVHKLHRSLLKQGLDAWIDDRIDYGSRWPREIEKRIRACRAFVLVMSPDADESEWVQNELSLARQLGKPIFPILRAGEPWWHLRTTQYSDARDGKLPPPRFFVRLAVAVAQEETTAAAAAENEAGVETEGQDNISVHVDGNVQGNIVIGDQNSLRSALAKASKAAPAKASVTKESSEARTQKHGIHLTTELVIALIGAAATIVAAVIPLLKDSSPPLLPPTASRTATSVPMAATHAPPETPTFLPASPTPIVSPSATPAPSLTPGKEAATSTATLLPLALSDSKGASMRLIPASSFVMGSTQGSAEERPIQSLYLNSFYIDQYEVTNALYKACVEASVCKKPTNLSSQTRPNYYDDSAFDNYPVLYVTWEMARTYCETWRGARLPSEAEWEKAARGTDARTYPWGEGIDVTRANYGQRIGDTTPVDRYGSGKSIYGVFDMAGNVSEWVSSLYKSYPYDANDGREELFVSAGARILRGGSWSSSPDGARSFTRAWSDPTSSGNTVGFRCAESLP